MNYIKQLNTFHELLVVNPLNVNSQCLYYALLNINNKCNWKKEFTIANSTLMGFTGLNKGQIERARNQLVQKGYIKYEKGENKCKAPIYEIIVLDTQNNTQDDTQGNTQGNTQDDTQTSTQPNTQTEHKTILNPVPLNKLNKTKQNKNNIKASKHEYGEYKNVLLKDEELQKLKDTYTNWEELITYLDEYIEMKGYKAKSHYLCIRKWVADAVKQKNIRNGTISANEEIKPNKEYKEITMSEEEYYKTKGIHRNYG